MEKNTKIAIGFIVALGLTWTTIHLALRKKGTHSKVVSKIFRVKQIDKMYKNIDESNINKLDSAAENEATKDGIDFR